MNNQKNIYNINSKYQNRNEWKRIAAQTVRELPKLRTVLLKKNAKKCLVNLVNKGKQKGIDNVKTNHKYQSDIR